MDPRLGGLSRAAACWRFVAPTFRACPELREWVGIFLRPIFPATAKQKRSNPSFQFGVACHPEPAVLSGGRRISAVVFCAQHDSTQAQRLAPNRYPPRRAMSACTLQLPPTRSQDSQKPVAQPLAATKHAKGPCSGAGGSGQGRVGASGARPGVGRTPFGPTQAEEFLPRKPEITTLQSRVSVRRDSAAFPSNSSPFVGRQQYTIDSRSTIRAKGCAQAARVIVHTRPRPLLGAFGQTNPRRAEVNTPRFFV